MRNSGYYRAAELFRATAKEIKEISAAQQELAMSGLMINRLKFHTSLSTDHTMQGLKFADNSDLFLAGKHNPPYLKFTINIAVSAKG